MSHLRPDEKPKHSRSQCRKGRHLYGVSQHIGGGIVRQVCDVCGEITIDLSNVEDAHPRTERRPKRARIRAIDD